MAKKNRERLATVENIRKRARQLGLAAPLESLRGAGDVVAKLADEFGRSKATIARVVRFRALSVEESKARAIVLIGKERAARIREDRERAALERAELKRQLALKRKQARTERALANRVRRLELEQERIRMVDAALEKRAADQAARETRRVELTREKNLLLEERRSASVKVREMSHYPSQRLPQIPAVRLGAEYAWIPGALGRHQLDFKEKNGVPIEMAQIVRKALTEVLSKRFVAERSRSDETRARIGPFRVTAAYPNLLAEITAAAKRSEVNESDVIRSALAQWLTERGYDKPGKRGKR